MTDRHLISVLLENSSGALSRVVGLFSARGRGNPSAGYQLTFISSTPGSCRFVRNVSR